MKYESYRVEITQEDIEETPVHQDYLGECYPYSYSLVYFETYLIDEHSIAIL